MTVSLSSTIARAIFLGGVHTPELGLPALLRSDNLSRVFQQIRPPRREVKQPGTRFGGPSRRLSELGRLISPPSTSALREETNGPGVERSRQFAANGSGVSTTLTSGFR